MNTLKAIPVTSLLGSPTNPRKTYDEQAILELAESLSNNGQLQNMLVRPVLVKDLGGYELYGISLTQVEDIQGSQQEDEFSGYYEVICGNRRRKAFLSLQKKSPDTIVSANCEIREMTIDEVLNAQIDENCQRVDLSPFEEGEIFKNLNESGVKIPVISKRFSRKQDYVHRRIKLSNVLIVVREAYQEGRIAIKGCDIFARMSEENQKALLDLATTGHTNEEGKPIFMAPGQIKELANYNFFQNLALAPFDIEDATLDTKAGACTVCPKNSSCAAAATLFMDLSEAHCTDLGCLNNKKQLWFIRQYKMYEKECKRLKVDPIFLSITWYMDSAEKKEIFEPLGFVFDEDSGWPNFYNPYNVTVAEPEAEGARPIFCIKTNENFASNNDLQIAKTGEVIYVTINNSTGDPEVPTTELSEEEKAERRERNLKNREQQVTRFVWEECQKVVIDKLPSIEWGKEEYVLGISHLSDDIEDVIEFLSENYGHHFFGFNVDVIEWTNLVNAQYEVLEDSDTKPSKEDFESDFFSNCTPDQYQAVLSQMYDPDIYLPFLVFVLSKMDLDELKSIFQMQLINLIKWNIQRQEDYLFVLGEKYGFDKKKSRTKGLRANPLEKI